MKTVYKLRDYQQRVIDQLWHWFGENKTGHPLMGLPTGSGKSLIVAEICRLAMEFGDQRILIIVPSKELCEQNHEKLLNMIDDQSVVGVLSASLDRFDYDKSIIIGTIGTIFRRIEKIGKFDLIIIDEAHLTNNDNVGMIRSAIEKLTERNPALRVCGLTATPFRGDGVWLHKAKNSLFTDVAASVEMMELIKEGYLCKIAPAKTSIQFDASSVKRFGSGDFVISELDSLINKSDFTREACRDMAKLGADRKSWIVFCVTVDHAHNVGRELVKNGIDAEVITGMTPKDIRASMIDRHRSGELQCLVSIGVLTTGFDSPGTDFIGMLRNTRSPILWVQMIGRAMRPHPNKKDKPALIADYTDNSAVMGPVNKIQGRKPRSFKMEAITKQCPECKSECALGLRTCFSCGHIFDVQDREIKLNRNASGLSILDEGHSEFRTYPVTDITYSRHSKKGKTPSLRVDYYSGLRRVTSEWICIEHQGYAWQRAHRWWQKRIDSPIPYSVGLALDQTSKLRWPDTVTVDTKDKFSTIVRYDFNKHPL